MGLAWGEEEGEILLHPDEAVRGVITAISSASQKWALPRAVAMAAVRGADGARPADRVE